ncbi:MAG: DUF3828 domain-containing protein, partial [Prevotellaceae bacterium]|nr:DUF3828 domain-containing protein [Prevotellaceae bacterium]
SSANDTAIASKESIANDSVINSNVEEEVQKDYSAEMMDIVQRMYNDILSHYSDDDNGQGQKYAFNQYASKSLLKLLHDVNEASEKTNDAILGWNCDPWIFAQDWIHPKAKVAKAYALSDTKGKVDVVLIDNSNKNYITLFMTKEEGQWKVNDFIGTESADYAPTFTEVLKEEMEEVLKNAEKQ